VRVLALLRRAVHDLRAFWAANLRVAGEWRQDRSRLLRYVLATWVVDAIALAGATVAIPAVRFDSLASLVVTVLLISAANALVRPIVVRFLVRYAVLTFGLLSLAINGLMIGLVAQALPGFQVGNYLVAFGLSLYLAVVNLALGVALDLDWADSWYRQVVLELVRRDPGAGRNPLPGLVIVQVDGLAEGVLRFAIRTGNAPHLARWVRSGTHRLARWDVLLPSQTSASQAGILHGNNDGIPAFRWYEKATGRLMVSNRPGDAAEIERRVSDGHGLLANGGSSVTNLLSGDAPRSVLTNSTLLADRGIRSRDFFGFFADPSTVFRTIVLSMGEIVRERLESRAQRLRGVEPRIARSWPFPFLRAAASVLLRDLSVQLVLEDMYRGVPVIYVDLVGYDEIAHHAGPERPEAIDAITEVDRQIGILDRAASSAPRPYRVVVLSDHGQSQGATFRQRYGISLEALVRDLMEGDPAVYAATSAVEGWGYVNTVMTQLAGGAGPGALIARRRLRTRGLAGRAEGETPVGPRDVVVTASGNLAHIYLTGFLERCCWEDLADSQPGFVEALASHPGIGLVMVRSEAAGPVVLGGGGMRRLQTGEVTGRDPLDGFGPHATAALLRLDGFTTVGDLVVLSTVDGETGEVAAFEELVGSHGGLGGAQTEAFLLYPAGLDEPTEALVGAPAVHRTLVGWLESMRLRPPPA
jgi:uncharacterized membrane protein YvlD (DUF360 family)